MMTLHEIAEAEARANATTPGPWNYERDDEGCSMGEITSALEGRMFKVFGDSAQQYLNAGFVSAARTDVPALCETARRAIELLQRWHDQDVSSEDYEQMIADFLAQVTKEP